jgi:hypothetical protein
MEWENDQRIRAEFLIAAEMNYEGLGNIKFIAIWICWRCLISGRAFPGNEME